MRTLVIAMVVIGAASAVLAGEVAPVPEIDASSALSAVTVVAGGLVILRARRKR